MGKAREINCKQGSERQKKLLILFNKRLQMLRNLREGCSLTSKKSQWSMSALMQLLSLPRNEEETLTRLLENGNQRQMMFLLRLRLAKRNAETWLMKSKTSWINLAMVVAQFTSSTNNVVVLRLRKKSFKLPLGKQKQLWNKRRIRFFVPS